MGRFRYNIGWLMASIIVIAVGMAALVDPNELWSRCIFSIAVGLGLAAITAAIARKGRARAAFAGAAVCGWGYLAFAFAPVMSQDFADLLVTEALIRWVQSAGGVSSPPFAWTAHSLFGIAAGVAGGLFAWSLWTPPEGRGRAPVGDVGPPGG